MQKILREFRLVTRKTNGNNLVHFRWVKYWAYQLMTNHNSYYFHFEDRAKGRDSIRWCYWPPKE